ncbi:MULTISPECIES: hypothetical protein [Jeotgalibaca]|uniref:DUF7448 domain-containing protein n=1 Tax=Jeotgalibaca TaxID=1470540 RepID=UPI00359FCF13
MNTIELLKQKILYKRIKEMNQDYLILEDGTKVYFDCTEQDCCATASGEWKTAELDAVITDVKMVDYIEDAYGDGVGGSTNTAKIILYHNQNNIAQADLYADDGNGGYYYSVLSVFVNDENIGAILSR